MKEIIVLSGKGGTGKTFIAACLAMLSHKQVLADCDVDAGGLSFVLRGTVKEKQELLSRTMAYIDEEICNQCGLCQDVCRSRAISDIINDCTVDTIACRGCRLCYNVCPENAITMKDRLSGHWFISNTEYGQLVHAELGITEENSGRLVSLVRQKAREIAQTEALEWIIADGPAGTGSPVISSLFESSLALLVTEPTLTGINGLEKILGLCRKYHLPALVCINKYDINEENARNIEDYCREQVVDVAARIPFDTSINRALGQGILATEATSGLSDTINRLWESISKAL